MGVNVSKLHKYIVEIYILKLSDEFISINIVIQILFTCNYNANKNARLTIQ